MYVNGFIIEMSEIPHYVHILITRSFYVSISSYLDNVANLEGLRNIVFAFQIHHMAFDRDSFVSSF